MAFDRLVFSVHAVQRMFEHEIGEPAVRDVLLRGDIIEEHRLDQFAVKRIYMAFIGSRPVHVVAVDDEQVGQSVVVTTYEPDLDHWHPGFRRRRSS